MQAIRLTIAISVLAVGGFAAETIGSITSSGTFALRGVPVKTEGIPSWPLVVGDEVSTSETAISIQFVDGSRIKLAQKSKALITKKEGKLTLQLVNGTMDYKLARGSHLILLNNITPVSGTSGITTVGQPTSIPRPVTAVRPPPPPPMSTQ